MLSVCFLLKTTGGKETWQLSTKHAIGYTTFCPQRSEADDKAEKKERSSKAKTSRNEDDKESRKDRKSNRKRVISFSSKDQN
jgi:hypothetical protein